MLEGNSICRLYDTNLHKWCDTVFKLLNSEIQVIVNMQSRSQQKISLSRHTVQDNYHSRSIAAARNQ